MLSQRTPVWPAIARGTEGHAKIKKALTKQQPTELSSPCPQSADEQHFVM